MVDSPRFPKSSGTDPKKALFICYLVGLRRPDRRSGGVFIAF